MNYRNRALLDLARDAPCMGCGKQDGTTVAAHSNWREHGKGMSVKAHDCFVAFLCFVCHAALDQGKEMSRDQRYETWLMAHFKTMLYLWQKELIGVRK